MPCAFRLSSIFRRLSFVVPHPSPFAHPPSSFMCIAPPRQLHHKTKGSKLRSITICVLMHIPFHLIIIRCLSFTFVANAWFKGDKAFNHHNVVYKIFSNNVPLLCKTFHTFCLLSSVFCFPSSLFSFSFPLICTFC